MFSNRVISPLHFILSLISVCMGCYWLIAPLQSVLVTSSDPLLLRRRRAFTCQQMIPEARFSKIPKTFFGAQKAIHKIPTRLFCKDDLFICCKGNKNSNNCKVSCLETPLLWRYKENYVTRNAPEKFRDFRETGPRTGNVHLISN